LIYDKALNKEVYLVIYDSVTNLYYSGLQHTINQPYYYFIKGTGTQKLEGIKYKSELATLNPFIGIIPENINSNDQQSSFSPIIIKSEKDNSNNNPELYIIGGGRYVLSEILPVFKDYSKVCLCDFNYEILSLNVYSGFHLKTNDFYVLLDKAKKSECQKVCIIASYHSYHSVQAVNFLKTPNSKVIIEKPPCVTKKDFELLYQNYDESRIYIAYHRRFAPWNIKIKSIINTSGPFIATFQIQEIQLSEKHWYFSENQGTRISGNLCHWFDLAIYWFGIPKKLIIAKNSKGTDHSVYTIVFEDDSIATFIASDLGNGTRGVQEYINIKSKDVEIKINDYLSMSIWKKGKSKKYVNLIRNKGHRNLNKFFNEYLLVGKPSPYSKRDFVLSSITTIKFVELFYSNESVTNIDFSKYLYINN
jgi:hypothetical protein